MSLFALSVASGGGTVFATTPLQDFCTAGLCIAGLSMLAFAAYILQKAPPEIKDRRV
jgi:hypothetical protein